MNKIGIILNGVPFEKEVEFDLLCAEDFTSLFRDAAIIEEDETLHALDQEEENELYN